MEAFHSVFVVPVAAFAMVLGIVIVAKISEWRTRQMEYEERMAMIAKGLPLPPPSTEASAVAKGTSMMSQWGRVRGGRPGSLVRRWGIVLVAFGLGLALFFITLAWILNEREVLSGAPAALIPFSIGVGLLIDSVIQKRELAEESEA